MNVVQFNIVGITIILRVKFCNRNIFLHFTHIFTMLSIISIVEVVLNGKENYPEWSWKIQHNLIFNELWKGVCVGEGDEALV